MNTAWNHYLPTELRNSKAEPWGINSRAVLALRASRQAVVFVHGFLGGAISTWVQFPSSLPTQAECTGVDSFFWGYDWKRGSVDSCASQLTEFLDALIESPATNVLNPSKPRTAPARIATFRYKRIVICAHSLGGIIVRKALLWAAEATPRKWAAVQLSPILFAPAHKGSHSLPLMEELFQAFELKALWRGATFLRPVLKELEPESANLRTLEKRTRALLQQKPELRSYLCPRVIHGGRDRVVVRQEFARDGQFEVVPEAGHRSICKPTEAFSLPLERVIEELQ